MIQYDADRVMNIPRSPSLLVYQHHSFKAKPEKSRRFRLEVSIDYEYKGELPTILTRVNNALR